MRLSKKLLLTSILLLGLLFSLTSFVSAESDGQEPPVFITFFWRDGCSHCADEKPFLQDLVDQYPQIKVNAYEVYYNSDNRDLLVSFGDALGFEAGGVPVTIIGDKVWIGFSDEKSAEIEETVKSCLANGCPDSAQTLSLNTGKVISSMVVSEEEQQQSSSTIWIIAAVVIVVASYMMGRILGKKKEKAKKRKKH